MNLFRLPRPVWAPEGAGDASGAASGTTTGQTTGAAGTTGQTTGAAGTAGQTAGAAGTTGQTSAAAGAYRPEGLPDHLFGASDRETIDRLAKAYGNSRETIGRLGEVPTEASGYLLTPSEKVKPYAENLDADPFWSTTKELALKHGFPAKQFSGFIGDMLEAMVDKALVAEPFSAEKERAALVPDVADPKERALAADKIINENIALVKSWKEQGLPEASAAHLLSTMDRAATNRLVDWIREGRGEQRPALGGSTTEKSGEAELDARVRDPRNTRGNPAYDKSYAAETQRLFRAFYGD